MALHSKSKSSIMNNRIKKDLLDNMKRKEKAFMHSWAKKHQNVG